MNSVPCIDPRDAAIVVDLPATDPRAAHARECPRCRALLDAYHAFASAEPGVVPADELVDADTRLTRALAAAIGAPPQADAPSPARRPVATAAPSFWRRLSHPAMRPAAGFALVAAVIAAVMLGPRLLPQAPGLTLRGEPKRVTFALTRAERVGDVVWLAWSAVPGAEAYQLRFVSGSLAELGRIGPIAGTGRELRLDALGFSYARGDTLMVRVQALAGGDVIATSPTRMIVTR